MSLKLDMTYLGLSVDYTSHLVHNPDGSRWLRPGNPFDVRGSTIPSNPRAILLLHSACKRKPLAHWGCHRFQQRHYACPQKDPIQSGVGIRWAVTVGAARSTSESLMSQELQGHVSRTYVTIYLSWGDLSIRQVVQHDFNFHSVVFKALIDLGGLNEVTDVTHVVRVLGSYR